MRGIEMRIKCFYIWEHGKLGTQTSNWILLMSFHVISVGSFLIETGWTNRAKDCAMLD